MYRNSVLLSISAALVFSLYFVDGGFAFQIDRNQNAGTASLPTKLVSTAPPCAGRTGVTCRTQSQPGSGATATDGSRYISESLLVSLPVAGVMVGAGLIALFGLGTKKLRHHHEHHA